MANLGTLTLDLVAKTGNFVSGLDKAERASKKFAEKTKRNMKLVSGAFVALGTATAAATVMMVNNYRQIIDENAKAAKQVEASYASFATLEQALGDAGVSMSTLMSASRTLNRELGKAQAGNEKAAEAFRRIGLSAKELAEIPLDKRIGIINEALDKNIHASQRAAAASEIFGSKNGQAMAHMSPDIIEDASRALDVFGLRLSDIDAAKVEQANSAMSNFGLITKGVGTQLTVELAPALKAIGDLFFEAAEEAGGMGNMVKSGVDAAVRALAFMADAADGVKRVFTLAADAIIIILNDIAAEAARVAYKAVSVMNAIPGLDFSQELKAISDFGFQANAVVKEAAANMQRTLDEPLAGQKLLEFYRKAQEEGEKAAAAAVADLATRRAQGQVYEKTAGSVGKLAKAQRDANEELIERLQLEAATLGMTKRERELYTAALKGASAAQLAQIDALYQTIELYEKTEKAASDYRSVVESLRTAEERRTNTLHEQLAIIRESGAASAEQAEMARRAAMAAADVDMPHFTGGDSGLGELYRYDQQEQELKRWHETQLEMLNQYRQEFADQSEVWDQKELEAREHFHQQMSAIDAARKDVMLTTAEEMFGSAAAAARQFVGENSKIYKALFAMEKAAAIARSIIAIQSGIAQAAANPWPMNLAAMASVAAATAGIVSNIMAVGMAHDGIDSVPKTGTWILEKGERVMTEKTSAKLDRTLDDVKKAGGKGGDVTVNLHEDASKAGKTQQSQMDDQTIIDIFVSNILQDGPAADALQGKYGLATVGR